MFRKHKKNWHRKYTKPYIEKHSYYERYDYRPRRKYGTLIKTGITNLALQEEKLLDFLKYSLLKVYGKFTSGYAPSAADVWDMFKDGKLSGCMACTPQPGNSCGC